MTNTERHEAGSNSAIPVALKAHFEGVVLPNLPQVHEGLQNAVKMLRDSQQPRGEYMVVLRKGGEPLPGMFVAAGETENPRLYLQKKLQDCFPDLKMGFDIFAMCVTVE
jgi:hypothetical protein